MAAPRAEQGAGAVTRPGPSCVARQELLMTPLLIAVAMIAT
jgi:hypothetical protein